MNKLCYCLGGKFPPLKALKKNTGYNTCSISLGIIGRLWTDAADCGSCSTTLRSIGGMYTAAVNCGGETHNMTCHMLVY